MSSPILVPRISVTMVSSTSDDDEHTSIIPSIASQKYSHIPPKILITPAQATVWYDEESSSSSESDESEDEDEDTLKENDEEFRRKEDSHRATHLTPPPTMTSHPLRRVSAGGPLRSPFSPLRNSYTAPQEEQRTSPSPSLPEDKKGLNKERFDGLLRASRERRAQAAAAAGNGVVLRVQTTDLGLKSPPPAVTSPSPAGRKSMDLRKEITLRAQVAKNEQRRQTFLARLLASPSSSPTTLTTPVTPPESPAEFHFTLPSPGLVSPLALFETLGSGKGDDDWEEDEEFDRVEKVYWKEEVRVKVMREDDEPRSPAARVNMHSGAMSLGMGMDSILLARQQQPVQQKANRLPIGVGRLQMPIGTGRRISPAPGADAKSTVIVPPRRGASLLHSTTTTPAPTRSAPSPIIIAPRQRPANAIPVSTGPRPRHPPTLNEITARLSASKAVKDDVPTWGGAPRSPLPASSPARSSARAAAFPDFLRERQSKRTSVIVADAPAPTRAPAPVAPLRLKPQLTLAQPGAGAVQPRHKDASMLVVPPSRPKSVDALQERVARGNAMMAKLSLGHRRRKSEEFNLPTSKAKELATTATRAADGWF